uniref:Cytochrome P450 2J2-like n=1 Tax=Electrophorus electricus TaxID=8005 RepID=A0A4W4FSE0_ELEEL
MTDNQLHISEWIDFTSVVLFSCVFLLFYDYVRNKTPKNFPPGPRSLPSKTIKIFAEKYGRVFSTRIFGERFVIVNGYKLVKKLWGLLLNLFLWEPVFYFSEIGVVSSNGYAWKQQRRFALSTLRNFGLGKKSLEPSIHVECRFLNDAISNEQGRPFNPQWLINNAVSNVICVLVFGDRFEYSDSEFQTLLKALNEVVYLEASIWAQMYNMLPWIMCRVPGPHQKIFLFWKKIIDFVRSKISEHRVNYDPSNPRDYIDCFLTEMEKVKINDEAAGFDMENLCSCTLDLFTAGTETTSTTMYWGLLYMIKYPEIQAKIQAEIDKVVGSSCQPSMLDKENLPYTNAVIHEIQRMANIIPLNLPRAAKEDTQIEEYFIPKGTTVLGNLTSVLFDESEWETPQTFNPGHFLDDNGNFRKREAFMPFSAGKRVCLGEQLARMELFLFFATLLQHFSFSPPEGIEPSLEYRLVVTLIPQPYQLCAVPR